MNRRRGMNRFDLRIKPACFFFGDNYLINSVQLNKFYAIEYYNIFVLFGSDDSLKLDKIIK